jgi:hypothetical protein
MQDSIVQPLVTVIDSANALLVEAGLDDGQQQVVHTILNEATKLRDLVIAVDSITLEKVLVVFDFEARQQLASIIGYTEMLLDDSDQLTQRQGRLLETVRRAGLSLLKAIT